MRRRSATGSDRSQRGRAGTHDQPLRLIAQRLQQLTHAEDVMVLVPAQPGQISGHTDILVVSNAVGAHANRVLGQRVPVNGSTAGEVFRSGTSVLTESYRHPLAPFNHVGRRPTIVTALRAGSTALGVIALTGSPDQPPFNNNVLELISDFAEHVSMALALATVRARGRIRHRRLHRPDPPTQRPDH